MVLVEYHRLRYSDNFLFIVCIKGIAKEVNIKSEINLFEDDSKVFSKLNDAFYLALDNINI